MEGALQHNWAMQSGGIWTQLDVKSKTAQRAQPQSRFLSTRKWLRGLDLNQRPSGYEPDELPGCSTPRLGIISMADTCCQRKKFQSNSKRTDAVSHPITHQFRVFQTDARTDAVMRPISAGRGKIGRVRIKSYLRRIMPETRHRTARMIPRRNEDDALLFLFAEQFNGELRTETEARHPRY